VGSATADDAGVYKLDDERALVQTLDFFTPIADDPFLYGQIAAANSLSDVYAMGGRPITAMAIAGMPADKLSNEEIAEIFRGGAEMVKQAKCALVGGHTIKNPEPIYGLSVTGIVHPDRYLANAHAQKGDVLILSKPLGTGIIATANKKGACSDELNQMAIEAMISLNTAGADLGEQGLVNACTDITGFGLLGHLREIADASGLTAQLDANAVPAIAPEVFELIDQGFVPGGSKKNLENVEPYCAFTDSVSDAQKLLFADAQTSGGLLLSVSPASKQAVLNILEAHDSLCAVEIGSITERQNASIVCS
jgi:selenide,water dikinase